jgi:2,3-bisphosphoglycerate-dependent phosphoglycerate mutase
MRLYFIRHAQSENNALWDRTGSDRERKEDPLLTDLGSEQARRVAQYVQECHDPQDGKHAQHGLGITHLYCSPMYRAAATAYQIGTALQIKPEVWVDWHECGGMFLENAITKEKESRSGMNRDEMEIHFPGIGVNEEIGKDGWWNKGGRQKKIVRSGQEEYFASC